MKHRNARVAGFLVALLTAPVGLGIQGFAEFAAGDGAANVALAASDDQRAAAWPPLLVGAPAAGSVLDAADHAVASALAEAGASTEAAAGLIQQQANLRVARALMAQLQQPTDDLLGAIALAEIATRHQASSMGVRVDDSPATDFASDAKPSALLHVLLGAHGVIASPQQVVEILALDQLPPPVRERLSALLFAFLQYDLSGRTAGENDARLLSARRDLLAAIPPLRDALTSMTASGPDACAAVQIPPIASIDLSSCDNLYVDDFVLLIDAGGDDRYWNNAGGSGIRFTPNHDPCLGVTLGSPGSGARLAAALVDLAGDDQYGDPGAPRYCGANGGGSLGSGFLLDAAGDDSYVAGRYGTNGGGFEGVGFLLDAAGDDRYVAGDNAGRGVNGGSAGTTAMGLLVDGSGDDAYLTPSAFWEQAHGANGGAQGGAAMLIDGGGDDVYAAATGSANGGASLGFGFLLDADGDDHYAAGGSGTNGGAAGRRTVGFLYDGAGDDTYTARGQGTNGGARQGVGMLLDQDGDDDYAAESFGVNGGAYLEGAVGFLVDERGDDTYRAASWGANGGAWSNYAAAGPVFPPVPLAKGLLWDRSGDDNYTAVDLGSNGGGSTGGAGLLIDETGDDQYTAGEWGANGGANYFATGLLFDGAGSDTYQDEGPHACSGQDRTCVPKGFLATVGAQVDWPGGFA